MEKMNKKRDKNGFKKGKVDGQDTTVEGRRTNSSAKVFSNLQKIVAADYKKRDEKREEKRTGKKAFRK